MQSFQDNIKNNQNEQSINDVNDLINNLKTDKFYDFINTENLFNVKDYCTKEILLRKSDFAIPPSFHKGILQYVLSCNPKDFISDERLTAWDISQGNIIVDDHHIRPLADATNIKQSSKSIREKKSHVLNSPLNRTLILRSSNQKISSKTPAQYLEFINESNARNHCVDKSCYTSVVKEDMEKIYEAELENRFKLLSHTIKTELDILIGK
ncbi:conserved domain protein [Turicibacter sp. HGF1]|uniref:hypothetical protein n=1 Tax=Turicibacter sp. HGF1 TaxID=910310 RepID=UPI0001FDB302|nr:hypothetical protein [Turicibacter sp. HGF1]EGC92750.1 conserved domain protein [Turicibacter sp. HGF1]